MTFRSIINSLILCLLLASSVLANDKPIIGVTMSYDAREQYSDRVTLTMPSIDAVTAAGGIPVLLPPLESEADVERYFDVVDGFLFTGGADINPVRYNQEKHETASLLAPRRENFDLMLMEKVLESQKPVLGICLGMQEMNVASGGSLIQDIPSQTESQLIHRGEGSGHDVIIVENTKLHELLKGNTFAVNSYHHQAVDKIGRGLTVTAQSPDGIVEGIKSTTHPFALGVQWHPEAMTDQEAQLNIIRGLVSAAKESAAQKKEAEKTSMAEPDVKEVLPKNPVTAIE